MTSIIPSLDATLDEESKVHSCCIRRRNSEALSALLRAPTEPLDREDQKRIVKALADEQKQQRELAGQLLTGVVGLVLLLHGYLLLQQSFRPWSTKLLAHFYDAGRLLTFTGLATSVAAYSTYLARVRQLGAGQRPQARLLTASKCAAAFTLGLWSLALWRAADGRGEGFKPALKFWWLPLGPSLLLALLEYTWAMFVSNAKDLETLKSHMYNFKSA